MAKYVVFKDNEGDWTIIPAGQTLEVPVLVSAIKGSAAETLDDVAHIINEKPEDFKQNQTNVRSQSVVDRFGPFTQIGTIEVEA